MAQEMRYQVVCIGCGQVWSPAVRSPLWWKAKKRAEQGYLDALCVSPQECGCKPEVREPDARYRVVGYTDMCDDFDLPFHSLVKAAQKYLELARDGMYVVCFVDNTVPKGKQSKVEMRLRGLAL